MRTWLPTVAMSVTLSIGVAILSTSARGAPGGAAAGAAAHAMGTFHGHGFRFRQGSVFRPRFLPSSHPFSQPHLNFGAGFASRRSSVLTGGYGDGDYAEDDIGDLHFRVQEPFGPGDIGRPPAGSGEDAPYMSDRMDPWNGNAPEE